MTGKFGITVLGSGSKGNAAVIHGPEGILLLDAGFSARELENRMELCEIDPDSIESLRQHCARSVAETNGIIDLEKAFRWQGGES